MSLPPSCSPSLLAPSSLPLNDYPFAVCCPNRLQFTVYRRGLEFDTYSGKNLSQLDRLIAAVSKLELSEEFAQKMVAKRWFNRNWEGAKTNLKTWNKLYPDRPYPELPELPGFVDDEASDQHNGDGDGDGDGNNSEQPPNKQQLEQSSGQSSQQSSQQQPSGQPSEQPPQQQQQPAKQQ